MRAGKKIRQGLLNRALTENVRLLSRKKKDTLIKGVVPLTTHHEAAFAALEETPASIDFDNSMWPAHVAHACISVQEAVVQG